MRLYRSLIISMSIWLLARWVYRRCRRPKGWKAGGVALITGGGSGIGLELAKGLATAQCNVVLVGRNEARLREAVEICKTAGAPRADFILADLGVLDDVQKVEREFTALHGENLNYLILNAGAGAIGPFTPGEPFRDICSDLMRINYFANVWLLQCFLPQLCANQSGESPSRVVVISSLAAVLPSTWRSAYTASKHALQGFINALRGECAISFTLCCPNYINTDFHQKAALLDGNEGTLLKGHSTRRGISPSICAKICLDGALRGEPEMIMSFSGKIGYTLRPLFPGVVDAVAKWVSLKSIQGKNLK
ncbi:unnamed protein product [Phytomonas sp. Hart1]|nr:unnamed protein product [Phytomonas sp. Hart1]|eukprot:CCW69279.1 unnamed protein product [Phytomonas sp. isolate Hart1]